MVPWHQLLPSGTNGFDVPRNLFPAPEANTNMGLRQDKSESQQFEEEDINKRPTEKFASNPGVFS